MADPSLLGCIDGTEKVSNFSSFLNGDGTITTTVAKESILLSVYGKKIYKPPSSQGVKKNIQRHKPQPNSDTGSYKSFPVAIREPRHLDVQGSDSSSSSTLVNDSLSRTKKLAKSNTGAASAEGIHGKRSSMSSDTSKLSLELPRHADKDMSGCFSKNSYLIPCKKQKANRTSYTVQSISNCSARIPQASNRSLATVKSMTLCTSLVQPDLVPPLWSEKDNTDSLDEEDPKNSTWNETSLKPLFQDFLPEFAISPIKGVAEKHKKKLRITQRRKASRYQSSPYKKNSQKHTTNQRCCAVKVDDGKAKRSSSSAKSKRFSARINNEEKGKNSQCPVLTEKSVQRDDSSLVDPLTSTRVYPEKHPLFEPDISAVEATVAQAQVATKSHAREYCTEELLCYDPLPLQASNSVGYLAEQIREEDVTPETEEQKLRRLTVPSSVRRLELPRNKAPDCVVESFAVGIRKKAKLAVCRVQQCETRKSCLKNTTESIVMDSLIEI